MFSNEQLGCILESRFIATLSEMASILLLVGTDRSMTDIVQFIDWFNV